MTKTENIRKWVIQYSHDSSMLTDDAIVYGLWELHGIKVSKALIYKASGGFLQRVNLKYGNPKAMNVCRELLKHCSNNVKLARLLINYTYESE